jgi:hypothetical protein
MYAVQLAFSAGKEIYFQDRSTSTVISILELSFDSIFAPEQICG